MSKKIPTKFRVNRITIKNILGIDELDFAPGKVTIISGGNGTGKTSALESVRSVVEGGHDATLLRNGADKGEIVIVLDDGTKLSKTVKAGKSVLNVQNSAGGDVTAPKSFVDGLVDTFSWNPIEFITAKKDKRVQTLLEMTPFKIDPAKIPTKFCTTRHILSPSEPLVYLDAVRKDIFDNRTGVNRILKEKTATAKEIRDGLPPEDETISSIDARLSDSNVFISGMSEDANTNIAACQDTVRRAQQEANNEIHRLELDAQKQIKAFEQKLAADKAHATQTARAVQDNAAIKIAALREELEQTIAPERETVAQLTQRRDDIQRSTGSRELAAKMDREAIAHEIEATAMTKALDSIDALKLELMAQLPLKGVEIKNGDIYIGGVPFDRVNEAKKVEAAIQLAELRCKATKLPFICVDGLERMDEYTFSAFVEAAKKTDIQFIVSRVTDDQEIVISTAE